MWKRRFGAARLVLTLVAVSAGMPSTSIAQQEDGGSDASSQAPMRSAMARAANAFNPAISAILQGRASYFSDGGSDREIPGFLIGGETGRGPKGVALGESELVLSANVDDKLYGFFDVSFDQEEIGIEEAYLETLSAPAGLHLKGGRFLSAVGYQNDRHSHTWDFIDQPLVYEAFLGGSLADPGVQLSWVAPTDLYLEFGAEVLRGDGFPGAGAVNSGFGTQTLFARLAGDMGDSSSWKTGLALVHSEAEGRESAGPDVKTLSFRGRSGLLIADFVFKWAPLGNSRERNFTFQAEYMHRRERGTVAAKMPTAKGRYRGDLDGFYVQGVYQFVPRWRVGVRYDQLFSDSRLAGLSGTTLGSDGDSPRRISSMIDFSNSEFSRVRLQYSFESGGLGNDSLVLLQYIISIGAHGAHAF